MPDHPLASSPPLIRNDWTGLAPPDRAGHGVEIPVTVLVTGAGTGDRLSRTLAALAAQAYPPELLDTVVLAPEGADVSLPASRPERCRVVAAGSMPDDPVGTGADRVWLRVPAGTVFGADFVRTMVAWPAWQPDVVSIAPVRAVPGTAPDVDTVARACRSGALAQLLAATGGPARLGTGGDLLSATEYLRSANQLAFLAVEGAPFAFRAHRQPIVIEVTAEPDVVLGFRLAQSGAVFVPEPSATVWQLDAPPAAGRNALPQTGQIPAAAVAPGQTPPNRAKDYKAPRSALLPYLPPAGNGAVAGTGVGSGGRTPLVLVTVPLDGPVEQIRDCVARLLDSDEPELRVLLVPGPTGSAQVDLSEPVTPEAAGIRQLATESGDRVTLAEEAPASAYPSPYLLQMPSSGLRVGRETVRRLVAAAEYWQVGLIRLLPVGAGNPGHAAALWATAALTRALRAGTPVAELPAMVAATHGSRWEAGEDFALTDVTQRAPATSAVQPRPAPPEISRADRLRDMLESGGLPGVTRTALFVARKRVRTLRGRLGR